MTTVIPTGGSIRSAQTATIEPNTLIPKTSVPATPIACVARYPAVVVTPQAARRDWSVIA